MSDSTMARRFLGFNAVFSLCTGLAAATLSSRIAQTLFAQNAEQQATVIMLLGIGLVLFAGRLLMLVESSTLTAAKVRAIAYADIIWVVLSGLLLLFGRGLFTGTGVTTLSLIALVVTICAAGQYKGAARMS